MKSIAAKIDVNGEVFVANGSSIIEENWTAHYSYYKHKDVFVPELKPGQELTLIDRALEGKETKPPARYSQGKLVQKMEELGLGTKATRHSIIQTLSNRGYIRPNPLEPS